MDKKKIKPWLLPVEEVERMPGVTLEDLRKIRNYGTNGDEYPTIWYEKYPDTFFGRLIVARYLYTTRKRTVRNTLIRAYVFRAVGKLLGKNFRKRSYQHASFWLFASTGKYFDKSFRRFVKAQNKLFLSGRRKALREIEKGTREQRRNELRESKKVILKRAA